jgi:hypothetical protein
LLVALYPHLHGRRSHLAELVLAEAQRIGRLEQHPTRTFVNDVEVTDEITDEMIQDGLDTFEGLDLSRGRSPRELILFRRRLCADFRVLHWGSTMRRST